MIPSQEICGKYKMGKQYFEYEFDIEISNSVREKDGKTYSLLSTNNKTNNICRIMYCNEKPVGILVVYNQKEVEDSGAVRLDTVKITERGYLVGLNPELREPLAIIVVIEDDYDLYTKDIAGGIGEFMSNKFEIGRNESGKIPMSKTIEEAIRVLISHGGVESPLTSQGGVLKPPTKN